MNNLQGSKLVTLFVAVMITGLAFMGCENEKLGNVAGPNIEIAGDDGGQLAKKNNGKGKGNQTDEGNEGNGLGNGGNGSTITWPIIASKTYSYNNGQKNYKGDKIEFGSNNKSTFELEDWSLTPPADHSHGKDITLTMEIDYNENTGEMNFSFGPHGCQFSPRAELKIDFSVMGVDVPKLYYLEDDGSRTLQQPEQISTNKRWLKISLDHFSRYALVRG